MDVHELTSTPFPTQSFSSTFRSNRRKDTPSTHSDQLPSRSSTTLSRKMMKAGKGKLHRGGIDEWFLPVIPTLVFFSFLSHGECHSPSLSLLSVLSVFFSPLRFWFAKMTLIPVSAILSVNSALLPLLVLSLQR